MSASRPRMQLLFATAGTLFVSFLIAPLPALAGVVMDGTLGRGGALSGPNYAITANLGRQQGNNLFQSFSEFNLVKNDIATFSGPASVTNIISRVTGGSASSIDGTVKSTIDGANLYFVNPHGIMFGPNARLDVSGSFHATTADYLKMGSDGRFDARVPENSLLTSAPPSAFGFVAAAPAAIKFDGTFLQTAEGKNLVIVGGDVTLTNTNLYAPAGNIEIVSSASAGTAELTDGRIAGTDFSAYGMLNLADSRAYGEAPVNPFYSDIQLGTIDTSGASRTGNIFLRSGNATLSNAQISYLVFGDLPGGTTRIITDGDLILDNYSSLTGYGATGVTNVEAARIQIMNYSGINSFGSASTGGSLSIKASDSIDLTNGGGILVSTYGTGDAGDAAIETAKLNIDFGYISAVAASGSAGKGGALQIKASDSVNLANAGFIAVSTMGAGDGGTAAIETSRLNINNGFITATANDDSTGKGGALQIKASDSVSLANGGSIELSTFGAGDAGTAVIETTQLSIDNGDITAATSSGSGRGGFLTIKAGDSVTLTNGGFITVATLGAGDAGAARIEAKYLNLDTGGCITAETYSGSAGKGGTLTIKAGYSVSLTNGSSIEVSGAGAGDAGSATIETTKLNIENNGYIAAAAYSGATGKGGSLVIKADDSVNLTQGGQIELSTSGEGDAGSVTIETAQLNLNYGSITAGTGTVSTGKGGVLTIKASDSVNLINESTIAVATLGDGDAGSATIETMRLNIDKSFITAGTYSHSTGKGGDLSITAGDSVNLTNEGIIEVSTSGPGDAGSATIETTQLNIDHGQIYAVASSDSTGKGGILTIKASDSVNLEEGGSIEVSTMGAGNAGTVIIETAHLEITNADITARTYPESSGNGGILDIRVSDSARLAESASINATVTKDSRGTGGDIRLTTGQLILESNSEIASESLGNGTAGDITIVAGSQIKMNNSSISTATTNADGGSIFIDPALVDMHHSSITTSVNGGTGNGGNIDLAALNLVLDKSIIMATADAGNGGNINLLTDTLIQSADSVISASSRLGLQGTVFISSPLIDLGASLAVMPDSILDSNALLPKHCATTDEEISSFTVLESATASTGPDRPLVTP